MAETNKESVRSELFAKREVLVAEYETHWHEMIHAWNALRRNDAVWLMYAANYLFNTRNTKWAVDPVLLHNRVPEAKVIDTQLDLAELDFILLTHEHSDHVDTLLWSQLYPSRCKWIIPEHMLDYFSRHTPLNAVDYAIAVAGKNLTVAGASITPFCAPHDEYRVDGSVNHVEETGYLVETTGGTYLLPGDIRTFDSGILQPYRGITAVFAHVFLGRSAALSGDPPLLEAFIDFYRSCDPQKIVLTHLYELGREPEDCWRTLHAETISRSWPAADGSLDIIIPEWYQEIIL